MAKGKRGLAAASEETRRMVGQKGGRAYHRSRGPKPKSQRNEPKLEQETK